MNTPTRRLPATTPPTQKKDPHQSPEGEGGEDCHQSYCRRGGERRQVSRAAATACSQKTPFWPCEHVHDHARPLRVERSSTSWASATRAVTLSGPKSPSVTP